MYKYTGSAFLISILVAEQLYSLACKLIQVQHDYISIVNRRYREQVKCIGMIKQYAIKQQYHFDVAAIKIQKNMRHTVS